MVIQSSIEAQVFGQFLEEVVGIERIVGEHQGHDSNECYNHMLQSYAWWNVCLIGQNGKDMEGLFRSTVCAFYEWLRVVCYPETDVEEASIRRANGGFLSYDSQHPALDGKTYPLARNVEGQHADSTNSRLCDRLAEMVYLQWQII